MRSVYLLILRVWGTIAAVTRHCPLENTVSALSPQTTVMKCVLTFTDVPSVGLLPYPQPKFLSPNISDDCFAIASI